MDVSDRWVGLEVTPGERGEAGFVECSTGAHSTEGMGLLAPVL